MKARQTKFVLYTTVYVLIVLAALGVLNFLANRYNKSYDATANKQFTLSDQTSKVARELKQDVNITYWDKPTAFQPARDLLDRYQNLSSKINVTYLDVDKNRTKAIAAGIKNFGAIHIDTGEKHEEAKSLSEEEVTGAIVRALKGGARSARRRVLRRGRAFDQALLGGKDQEWRRFRADSKRCDDAIVVG